MFNNKMFKEQQVLQELLKDRYPVDLALRHLIACTELSKEVHEVLDCVPWKMVSSMPADTREQLCEELVDVFKFFMNLLIIHGITSKEFEEAYTKKSKKVRDRLCPAIKM